VRCSASPVSGGVFHRLPRHADRTGIRFRILVGGDGDDGQGQTNTTAKARKRNETTHSVVLPGFSGRLCCYFSTKTAWRILRLPIFIGTVATTISIRVSPPHHWSDCCTTFVSGERFSHLRQDIVAQLRRAKGLSSPAQIVRRQLAAFHSVAPSTNATAAQALINAGWQARELIQPIERARHVRQGDCSPGNFAACKSGKQRRPAR